MLTAGAWHKWKLLYTPKGGRWLTHL